ncbi:MAG: pyruvate formate lyase family protein [Prolixibacteraceae bacterium]
MNNSPFLGYYIDSNAKINSQRIINCEPDANQMAEILLDFTTAYKSFKADEIEMREALCSQIQLKGRVRPIQDIDLFAGRLDQMPIGFTPQSMGTGMGYCIHPDIDTILLNNAELTNDNKVILEELMKFWQQEGTVYKSRRKMLKEVTDTLPSELYYLESGIAFMLYRMSGIQLDYHKLLKLGIEGLKAEIANFKSKQNEGTKTWKLYTAMEKILDTFTELAHFYALQASEQAKISNSPTRKEELITMAAVLNHIATKKPETFRQGLQLMYLYNILDDAKNYGRMDDYMGDLYSADMDAGRINKEEAILLMTSIWKLMSDRGNRYDTRLILGGLGRHNSKTADRFALMAMEVTKRVNDKVPQMALRFHKEQDPSLYKKALDVIATGNTYPMLYNDEVNVPAVQKAFNVPYEDAIHAIQYGCGEYVLNHRSTGTPSGVINLLQALMVTLNRGIDPTTGKYQGMPVERYIKYNNFENFNDLYDAYKEQVEYHVVPLAIQEDREYLHAAEDNAYLTSSILMDNCIARGKAIFDGGVHHLGGTLESYGNTNVADSLVAIKELVYDKKIFTLEELIKMTKANFDGYQKEHKLIMDCPKYGNDNDVADKMLCDVHDHICNTTRDAVKHTKLDSYLIVVINNDANTIMGSFTAASPDGRKAFVHLNPANNPVGGNDKSGVTAFLNSLVKPDTCIHAGAVQNMKFSKDMLTRHRAKFEMLLETYFEQGGAQAMLTVVSKGELEDAQKHPELYQNLIVRVGGFSEYFVNLPVETQNEILSRTLN